MRDGDGVIHFGIREKPGAEKTPRNPEGRPQLRHLAIVERVRKLPSPAIKLVTSLDILNPY